jgi:RNA polymerase sigma factor (sigma-70 family)
MRMAASPLSPVIEHLRRFAFLADAAVMTDEQLLDSFVRRRDELAFEVLIRRHGGMVMGVCRRVLGGYHDAEDAFQATFLVLSRKAASICVGGSLANWLYCVAFHTALKAKAVAAKRRKREHEVAEMPKPESAPPEHGRELHALLDQELSRLPEKYRVAIVLCDLEGRTRKEAAHQLGCPEGTVATRLARGRALLAKRLTQRGVTLSAAAIAGSEALSIASACVPSPLVITTTTKAAALYASGKTIAGVVSSNVAALAAGMLQTMVMTKLKTIALAALAIGLVAVGGGALVTRSMIAAQRERTQQLTPQVAAKDWPDPIGPPKPPEPIQAAAQAAPDLNQGPRRDPDGGSLPEGALTRLGTIRLRHGAIIGSLAFSPDGAILAASGEYYGGEDRSIYLWDVKTGRELHRLPGREGRHASIAFSPDGKMLASAGWGESTIRLWDTATGKELNHCDEKEPYAFRALTFSLSGDVLASVHAGPKRDSIMLWNPRNGEKISELHGHKGVLSSLAMSPDGKTVAAVGEGSILYVWTEGKIRSIQGAAKPLVYRMPLVFAPNGRTLAVACGDKTIRLYDLATCKESLVLRGHQGEIAGFAFSADGATLISGGRDKTLRYWDALTGKERRVVPLTANSWGASTMTFSPGATIVAAGGTSSAIRLLETDSGQDLHPSSGHDSPISRIAFRADNTLISTAWQGAIRHWDVVTGREVHRLERPKWLLQSLIQNQQGGRLIVSPTALSSDGMLLADFESNTIRISNSVSGQPLRSFVVSESECQRIAFSDDKETLAVAGEDNAIRLIDAKSGTELRKLVGHGKNFQNGGGDSILGMMFSPDGALFASSGQDRRTRLWDVATGRELQSFAHTSDVIAVAFSPDGKTLAAAGGEHLAKEPADNSIRLWEVATGKERCRLEGHQNAVWTLAFSPDGKTLASGGSDSAVRIWDAQTGKSRRQFDGHRGIVMSVAFSGDGARLGSGGSDTTVLIWNVQRPPLASYPGANLDALWDDLANSDAARAYRAMATLAATPGDSVPYFAKHLGPVPNPDRPKMARWIAELDSGDFAAREKASAELQSLRQLAAPALRRALSNQPSLESRRRIDKLLAMLSPPSAGEIRVLRAIEVLERAGTSEAVQLLEALAKGASESPWTRESQSSLQRLARHAQLPSKPRTPNDR